MKTSPKMISPLEYRRRVFGKFLMEGLVRLQETIVCGPGDELTASQKKDVRAFTEAFYQDELNIANSTVAQVRSRLSEANDFVQKIAEKAEEISDEKKADAEENGFELPDAEPELSQEDQVVMDQLFDLRKPDPEISKIRDATVSALVAEDQKAQEVKEAIEIAQQQEQEAPGTMEETVTRINKIGPTSLMNGLMNYFSAQAVKSVTESSGALNIGSALSDNKEIIKDRATIMYTLFEGASVLGIHRYSDSEIRNLAHAFYNNNV